MLKSGLSTHIYPVDNAWGKKGWTVIELPEVDSVLLSHILTSAYAEVAPKQQSKSIKRKPDLRDS